MEKHVVLVNEKNEQTGTVEITRAHLGSGMLHRAVSVIVFRLGKSGAELLMQKRSAKKPLWPMYWTNTVCSHPLPGEATADCAVRRLKEEMGISVTKDVLRLLFYLTYQAKYSDTLSEHELDAVYLVRWNGNPLINPDEAAEYAWMPYADTVRDVRTNPDKYTPWFRLLMKRDMMREAIENERI
jgi:isopentenyl-diphosphate Delta-isomerase